VWRFDCLLAPPKLQNRLLSYSQERERILSRRRPTSVAINPKSVVMVWVEWVRSLARDLNSIIETRLFTVPSPIERRIGNLFIRVASAGQPQDTSGSSLCTWPLRMYPSAPAATQKLA
jgi:hypothetical protein